LSDNKENRKGYKYKGFIMSGISVVLVAFFVLSYAYVWNNYYNIRFSSDRITADWFGWRGSLLMYCIYALLIYFFSGIYNGFKIGTLRVTDIIYSQTLSIVFINLITYLQLCLISRYIVSPVPMLVITVVDFAFIVLWAFVGNRIYSKLYAPRRMVIIYGSKQAVPLVEKMSARADRFMICRAIKSDEEMGLIREMIAEYDAVILCDVPSPKKNDIIKICFSMSKRIYITPKLSDIIIRGADQVHLFDTPLLVCKNSGLSTGQLAAKRVFDLVVSIPAFVITLPLMIIIAAAVKIYDGGPVFYTQERYTKDRRIFKLYKFRSMRVDAEKDGIPRLAAQNDDRITPIGKIIRMVRMDELPQFINVIKGDMSIVGPRPERPELAEINEVKMPEFAYRLKVKAGLTGYAQVMGKYNTTPYDKLCLDLMYIEQYSFLLDLKLIMMTIKILFIPESTEGVRSDMDRYKQQ